MKVISNLIIGRQSGHLEDENFFRLMHIVDVSSWFDLYDFYRIYIDVSEEVIIWETPIDASKLAIFMEHHGLIKVKRQIKSKNVTRTSLHEKTRPAIHTTKQLTDLGIQFLGVGFKNFKYRTWGDALSKQSKEPGQKSSF